MKRTRTTIPPLFSANGTALRGKWCWEVTMVIASNGYATRMRVEAFQDLGSERCYGSASVDLEPFVSVHEVMEALAVEAMLASQQQTLYGDAPHRACRLDDLL